MSFKFGLFPTMEEARKEREQVLIGWANRSASYMKRNGVGLPPPEGIFNYPDLLARGWGWKRLVTSESSPEDMPTYKKYLEEYYIRNTAESVAQEWLNQRDANSAPYGTGGETRLLATLAKLCTEAEEKFIQKRKMYKTGLAYEIDLSEKILQGVDRIMSLEAEFPIAPAALMFITKEAELMCEWLKIKTYKPHHPWCFRINIARSCALDFLEYKGPESSCVAGLMIGVAKETKRICEAMRKDPYDCRNSTSNAILLDGWDVLEALHGEFFSASQDGDTAEINTVGELTSKENDGKDSCKTKASADVNSANRNTFLEVETVNGLTDCIKKLEDPEMVKNEVATVNGVTDRISCKKTMKKLKAGEDCKTAKKVENCGKTALELKLDGDKAVRRMDYLAASMLYTQAIEVDPDNAILYSNRSLCHLEIGEANKALLDANSCIKIRPEWLKGYYRKGVALMSLKEYKEACDAFLAGLQLDPANVEMQRMIRDAIEAMKDNVTIEELA